MGRLVLSTATTETDISAFTNNVNIDNLLSTLNEGLDGTYNFASGAIGASGHSDLNSNLAGNGLVLSSNQLSVGTGVLTANNFSATAGILGSQFASNSVASLAANATSNFKYLLISAANPASGLKIVRGTYDPTGVAIIGSGANAGEGFTGSSTGSGATAGLTITFASSFSTTPVIIASQTQQGYSFGYASAPFGITSVSAAGFTVVTGASGSTRLSGVSFLALGT